MGAELGLANTSASIKEEELVPGFQSMFTCEHSESPRDLQPAQDQDVDVFADELDMELADSDLMGGGVAQLEALEADSPAHGEMYFANAAQALGSATWRVRGVRGGRGGG
eukprot:5916219-Pyramimonas_sp.AAC.1